MAVKMSDLISASAFFDQVLLAFTKVSVVIVHLQMTTLDVCESEESVTAVVMLLGMGIKKVPREVLKLKYSEMAKTFVVCLGKFALSDNTALLRSVSEVG
jgi:hypothetical protein